MSYGADLRRMLAPLGVYSEGGYCGGAAEALGVELDQAEDSFAGILLDLFPETAGQRGLGMMESLFPMIPAETEEARKSALRTLLQVGVASFTRSELQAILAGCGINVTLTEQSGMTLLVTLGERLTMEQDPVFLMWVLEQVLPCHLAATCVYNYLDPDTGAETQERLALETLRQRTRAQWETLLGAV